MTITILLSLLSGLLGGFIVFLLTDFKNYYNNSRTLIAALVSEFEENRNLKDYIVDKHLVAPEEAIHLRDDGFNHFRLNGGYRFIQEELFKEIRNFYCYWYTNDISKIRDYDFDRMIEMLNKEASFRNILRNYLRLN